MTKELQQAYIDRELLWHNLSLCRAEESTAAFKRKEYEELLKWQEGLIASLEAESKVIQEEGK